MEYLCEFYALNWLEVKFESLEWIVILKTIKENVKLLGIILPKWYLWMCFVNYKVTRTFIKN